MNQNFAIGFIKQAQLKGLKPLHAMDILKEAGPMDWLGKQWTDFTDAANVQTEKLFNNPITHAFNAATTSSPEGWFDGFSKRMKESESNNAYNVANYAQQAARHQARQGDVESMKDYTSLAQDRGQWIQNDGQMAKINAGLDQTTQFWNNQQAEKFNAQKAIDDKRAPIFNQLVAPRTFAEPGKALTPPPAPPAAPAGGGLLGAKPMPDLRTSFTADTNLRKPLGGY